MMSGDLQRRDTIFWIYSLQSTHSILSTEHLESTSPLDSQNYNGRFSNVRV